MTVEVNSCGLHPCTRTEEGFSCIVWYQASCSSHDSLMVPRNGLFTMDRLFFEVFATLLFGIFNGEVFSTGEVVYAVNSGGPAHTDLNGVHFQADKLTIGTSSDFGKSL